jgi:hypothetical protein
MEQLAQNDVVPRSKTELFFHSKGLSLQWLVYFTENRLDFGAWIYFLLLMLFSEGTDVLVDTGLRFHETIK